MHPLRRTRSLVPPVVLGVLLVACAGPGDADGSSQAGADVAGDDAAGDDAAGADVAGADVAGDDAAGEAPALRVVATVAPIADLVAQVGGDRVEVRSLVPPGADSHTYEPRPSDVAAIADADLYVGIGLALNDAALRLADDTVGDDVPVVRLGEEALDEGALVFDHDHGDGHGHSHDGEGDHGHSHDGEGDHGHSHDDDDGDHGHSHDDDGASGHNHGDAGDGPGPNPHVWTSVRTATELVDRIAVLLGDLDPDAAEDHLERADAYNAELAELDAATVEAVATIPEDARTLVTFHDAWTYFARDHDLEYATAVQPADFTEPSASEVRAVIDLVRELDVPAVFGSEVFPSRVLEAIASETDAVYVADLADDVLPGEPGDPEHSYLELMRGNHITLVEGLGGDASALR